MIKAYNQLADLEELLFSIPDQTVRAYAGDAIACYSTGANRAAIVSIWIAIVYDLYQKIRYLSEIFNDKAAIVCLAELEKIRADPDKRRAGAWEEKILDEAFNQIKMVTSVEHKHLARIREDRHLCAHPALDREGLLFQPTAELTRSHIRTAIEILLNQPALIGKAATEVLIQDVEGAYFPDDLMGTRNALKNRHLPASDKYLSAMFLKTLEKILGAETKDKNFINRYSNVAIIIGEDYPNKLENFDKGQLQKFLGFTIENKYLSLLRLLVNPALNSLWKEVPDFLKEKVKQFLLLNGTIEDKIQGFIFYPELKTQLVDNFLKFDPSDLSNFVNILSVNSNIPYINDLFMEVIKLSIEEISRSRSFFQGRENGKNLIIPLIPYFTSDNIKNFFILIEENQKTNNQDQLVDCASIFYYIYNQTIDKYPELLPEWDKFLSTKRKVHYINDQTEEIYYSWDGLQYLAKAVQKRLSINNFGM